jgi:hypothetical protein
LREESGVEDCNGESQSNGDLVGRGRVNVVLCKPHDTYMDKHM